MPQLNASTAKIIKYGITGVLGTLTHVAVMVLFVELVGLGPVLSSALGFVFVLIMSYYLNKYWTFRSQSRGYEEFGRYLMVSFTGLLLNTSIMFITVEFFAWHYVLGQFAVVAVVPASNFLLNNYWTFSKKG